MKKWYWFFFEDGYKCACAGFSKIEKQHMELQHGKIIKKELA